MSIKDILFGSGGVAVIAMTLLQVSKININPWSWLAKSIGKAINGEVISKVDKLERDLTKLRDTIDEREAVNCRTRILRFGDEVRHGERHSKDHFDQTLRDIVAYERYCEAHPDFLNNITEITSSRIKEIYRRCLEENDFLL